MANHFDPIQFAVEPILAAMLLLAAAVWLLFRRLRSLGRELSALQAEREQMQKKFDSGCADLHLRLERAEERLQRPPAPPSRHQTDGRIPGAAVELLLKVRQLRSGATRPATRATADC